MVTNSQIPHSDVLDKKVPTATTVNDPQLFLSSDVESSEPTSVTKSGLEYRVVSERRYTTCCESLLSITAIRSLSLDVLEGITVFASLKL